MLAKTAVLLLVASAVALIPEQHLTKDENNILPYYKLKAHTKEYLGKSSTWSEKGKYNHQNVSLNEYNHQNVSLNETEPAHHHFGQHVHKGHPKPKHHAPPPTTHRPQHHPTVPHPHHFVHSVNPFAHAPLNWHHLASHDNHRTPDAHHGHSAPHGHPSHKHHSFMTHFRSHHH